MTRPTVLLVEADLLARVPLADHLRGCGFDVVEAASGEEASDLLATWPQRIKAALVDIDGSPESALRLANWIRSRHPGIHLELVGTVTRALEAAAGLCANRPLLGKPYEHRLVAERIRRLLAETRPAG